MDAPEPGSSGTPDRAVIAPQIIVLCGDLDADATPGLRDRLNALILSGVNIIFLDCAALEYIDSTGLGLLVSALKQTANRNGALALIQPNERVSRVLRITGLSELFPAYANVDEARAALGLPAAA